MSFTRVLALSTVATAALSFSATASAECAVTTGGGTGDSPAAGATVDCPAPLDNSGVMGGADNVTVNIPDQSSAGLSTTGGSGVVLGDGATVTIGQAGQVVTSGDMARGLDLGNDATVTAAGTVSTSGGSSPAIRTGMGSTVDVSGVVRTGGGSSPAISVDGGSTVTVNMGGDVRTGNSMSDGVLLRGDGTTLNANSGALVTTSSGMSSPVRATGNNARINVMGDVRSSSGDSDAIRVEGDMGQVMVGAGGFVTAQSSNSDAIDMAGTGGTVTVAEGGEVRISSGNSAAIRSGDRGTVNVAGQVGISSSNSQGVVLGDAATLNVRRTGVISTSSSESQAVLIGEAATTATVLVEKGGMIDAVGAQAIVDRGTTNSTVTVNGTVFGGSSEPVIDMGAGQDTVIVNGTVRGTSANPVIDMGAGDDVTTINSAMTVEGPGVLVAGGAGMDTLNLANGQSYESSRFTGEETVNASMGTRYSVNDAQPMQTVNVMGQGSRATVDQGGSVMTLNSSMGGQGQVNMGGQANTTSADGTGSGTTVNMGGSVQNARSSGGGSTTVNQGGSVRNADADQGGSTNVNSGGQVQSANSNNGGSTNVNGGGRVANSQTGNGGTTNVNDGGQVDRSTTRSGGTTNVNQGGQANGVTSDAGGSVNVNNGGRANLADGPGGGGAINFRSGSSSDVQATATGAASASTRRAGVSFENGSTVNVVGSPFFTARGVGDTITVTRAPDAFATRAVGPNQRAVAGALDSIGATGDSPVVAGLVLTREPQIGATYDRLSGELFGSTAQGFANSARAYTDILLRRTATNTVPYQAAAGPDEAVRGQARFWIGGFGRSLEVDRNAGGLGFEATAYGGAAGAEFALGAGIVAGVSGGYSEGETRLDGLNDRADVRSYHAGAYVGAAIAGVDVGLAFGYGHHDTDTRRRVLTPAGTLASVGAFDGKTYAVSADASYDLAIGSRAVLAPVVTFNAVRVDGDFGEAGADVFSLSGDVGEWLVYGGAGAEFGAVLPMGNGGTIRPSARLTYERAFENDLATATAFAGAPGTAFDVTGFGGGRDRVRGSLGMAMAVGRSGAIALTAETTQGRNIDSYGGGVRVSVAF